jgi:ABC-2 type transport system ATP-binding protein
VGSHLALNAVTKRYSWRGPSVLRGVSLEVHPGSLTTIVGANGSGKSTLLRIAAGLVSPSKGTVHVPAKVGYLPERQPARLKFTPAEYVANMGHIKGLPARAIREEGAELFERLGLQPYADVPWETLSKGNRQKLLVTQAFLARSELIVLDEPYGGLDDRAREALAELVAEALGREAAVLVSAHRIDDVLGADRVQRLVSGDLTELEPPTGSGVPPARASKTIVLTTAQDRPLDPLSGLGGVERRRLDGSGRRLVLTVLALQADDVLRAALAAGWSVESVSVESVSPSRGEGG